MVMADIEVGGRYNFKGIYDEEVRVLNKNENGTVTVSMFCGVVNLFPIDLEERSRVNSYKDFIQIQMESL